MQAAPAIDLERFHREGWTPLGRIMDDATLEAIRAAEGRFRHTPLRNDQDHPDARTIFRSQVCAYAAAPRAFAIGGPHLPHVATLLGTTDVLFWYIQFVTKFPEGERGSSVFPWHQDNGYAGALTPALNVTVWVALDDVDENNGCVWVMPNSHRNGVLPHRAQSPDNWYMDTPVEGDGVPARLKAGEAVAFTGLTLHRSLANRTQRPRRGFFMGYADARTIDAGGKPLAERPDTWMVMGELPPPVGKIPAKVVG